MGKEVLDNLKVSPTFQKRLKDLVDDLNCDKKDLPHHIPVGYDVLARALNIGAIPGTKSLIKIADRFDVSVDFLIGLTDDERFYKSDETYTFQNRFKELRDKNDMTKFEVAQKLGIERSLFSIWEKNNYTPSLEILFSLAQFFKVSIDYLLGRTDENIPYKNIE